MATVSLGLPKKFVSSKLPGRAKNDAVRTVQHRNKGTALPPTKFFVIRETPADRHSRQQSSSMQYGAEHNISLKNSSLKKIRHSMGSQLKKIWTPPATNTFTWTGCDLRKMVRQPHRWVTHKYYICEILYTYVCGPMRTAVRKGERYIITFTDLGSR